MTAAFALTLTLALLAASSAGAHSLRMPLCRFSSLEGMAVDDEGAAVARSARHALDFAEFDKPLSADEHAFHHHHRRMARDAAADDLEPTIEKDAPTLQEEPLDAPAQQQQPAQQSQVEFFEGGAPSSDDAQLDDDQEATIGGTLDGLEPLYEANEELAAAKRPARQSTEFAGLFGHDEDSERPAVPATPQEVGLEQDQQGSEREGEAPVADSEDFPTPDAIAGDSAAQGNAPAAAAADTEPAAEATKVAGNDDETVPAAGENKSDRAETKAESAEAKVETAEAKVETAETKAESAESKVETAESKVESAEGKVETAEAKVESAETKGETAEVKAENAESKGETAEAKAENAETKGETAEAKAETADAKEPSAAVV